MTQPAIPEFLVCPVCKGPLLAASDPRTGAAAELVCPACELAYEVKDGIPVMIASQARPLPPEEARRWREKRDALRSGKPRP